MRRLGLIAVAAASLLAPGVMTSACDTAAPPPPSALEPPSLTDQLVGAWTLVSVHDVQGDGRLALRASYGLTYDYPTGEYLSNPAAAPPFGNRIRTTDPPGRVKPLSLQAFTP